jgi:hypothetical protein
MQRSFADPFEAVARMETMHESHFRISRRRVMTAIPALTVAPSLAALARPSALRFAAFRNGDHIGEQTMTFETAPGVLTVRTTADFAVKLGPITAYRYHHEAIERWRADEFATLETRTNQNGRSTTVAAVRGKDQVAISTAGHVTRAPVSALPFTHWNSRIAGVSLFNPQDGKLLREQVVRGGPATIRAASGAPIIASRLVFHGDAYVEDYYSPDDVWVGLVGRLADGSAMAYRLASPLRVGSG